MYTCVICGLNINKGDLISVVSSGINSLSDNAEYNYIPDLLDKEVIYHYYCFDANFSKDKIIYKKHHLDTNSCYITLKDMGENTNIKETMDFILSNKDISSEEEFITRWFNNRNKLIQ